jgi:hypothetical protein
MLENLRWRPESIRSTQAPMRRISKIYSTCSPDGQRFLAELLLRYIDDKEVTGLFNKYAKSISREVNTPRSYI